MSKTKPILNLKQFMLRQQVLGLYRNIFRTIRQIPDKNLQSELKEWARRDFRSNMNHSDEITIKMCLQYGERSLRELQNSINLAK